jgi:SAM-dependent methyltransferase
LNAREMVRDLGSKGFERIHSRYVNPNDPIGWPKYVDASQWLELAIKQARFLQLDRRKPVRVLDIGSGAGYFLFVCKQLGHSVMGLDLDWPPMYAEMFEMLKMPRRVWRIEPFQQLPDLEGRFDFITGFAVCFNSHGSDEVWGMKEWDFFLDDLFENIVSKTGEIYFELNPESWGCYTPELGEYFRRRGAWLEGKRVWFKKS